MSKPVVFMFSGQGSQYYQMGREFYLTNPTFRRSMLEADEIFRMITGESVVKQMYDDRRQKSEEFDRLLYTHPAIFMVEYSLSQVLLERGISPNYVLGASLGEYTAGALAGVLDREELIRCLVRQAQILEAYCQKGGMLAVLENQRLYEEEPVLRENSELAAVNFYSHFVISGSLEKLAEIEGYLQGNGTAFQRLPVSFAFHSSLLDPAAAPYTDFLKPMICREPKIGFLSCVTGHRMPAITGTHLWDVVRQPIRFQDAIGYLQRRGEHVYIDLGPTGTLANFTKYNLGGAYFGGRGQKQAGIFSILTPFNNGTENLDRLCGSLGNCNN